MFLPLSIPDNMHALLRMLYDDMMPLCGHMTHIASAIAGLGALLYISYRVWQSMARGEAIDVFPLLRPFALGLCIMLFQPLVLGGLNGILSPIVTGAHQLLTDRTLDMQQYQRQKDDLERESLARNPSTSYYVSDEEFDRQIGELGWSPDDLNTMENMYEERTSFSLRSLCVSAFRWLLEQLFEIASLIVDIIRTFYLIVLSILGPLVFAISTFDGFRDSLVHWLAKYVSVYLWLPIADIFGAVLARIQTLSLQQDMELTAIYGEEETEARPIVNFAIQTRTRSPQTGKDTVRMGISWSTDNDYTILEEGILRTYEEASSDNLYVGTSDSDVKHHICTNVSQSGSYTYNLTIGNTSANLNKSVYAVGYITYRDKQGDVHTVYTEVVEMAPVTN